MTLEHQVCSLELAKKLRKLGVKQESLSYWQILAVPPFSEDGTEHSAYEWRLTNTRPDFGIDQETEDTTDGYSAFTVAELGEMLPTFNPDGSPFQQLTCVKNRHSGGNEFSAKYHNANRGTFAGFGPFFADTEADARAKMLVYLIENQLVGVKSFG